MKKARSLYEMVDELRSGAEWVQSVISAPESSAIHLSRRSSINGVSFLVLNPQSEIRIEPFHFGLADHRHPFEIFVTVDEAIAFAFERLLSDDTRLFVVLGVLTPPAKMSLNLRRLWKAIFQTSRTEEARFVAIRKLILDLETLTTYVRTQAENWGRNLGVVQAIYDSSNRQVYWDLERALKPQSGTAADRRLVLVPLD